MNKIIKLLSQEVSVVMLLGVISVITAWAGVQSSLHSGQSNKSLSFYMEGLNNSNNLYLTSELKYRTDLVVWADKQTALSQGGDINTGYSAGSAELFELAIPCLQENPESQLAECQSYMDALYLPQKEVFDQAIQSLKEYEVWDFRKHIAFQRLKSYVILTNETKVSYSAVSFADNSFSRLS